MLPPFSLEEAHQALERLRKGRIAAIDLNLVLVGAGARGSRCWTALIERSNG